MNHPTLPDPLPGHIRDLLAMEGLTQESRLLIELAIEAQETGTMPGDLPFFNQTNETE